MSKRKADEAFRKPRFAIGTPAYKFSNLATIGFIAVSGFCWYLFDCWPESHKLLDDVKAGKWNLSPEYQTRIDTMKFAKDDPAYHELLIKAQRRIAEREEVPREQSWLVKIFTSTPDT